MLSEVQKLLVYQQQETTDCPTVMLSDKIINGLPIVNDYRYRGILPKLLSPLLRYYR